MKNLKTNIYVTAVILVLLLSTSCKNDDCEYTTSPTANCALSNDLNLSTGIDINNEPITPGKGVVDPFWKLLNNPPLIDCTSSLASNINGSAYLINFANAGSTGWVNQPNATTICPVDLGTTDSFGCNNATNSSGIAVPYVFERSFCVLKDTKIDFSFTYRGDDQLYLQLVNNNTNAVISTSTTYVFPGATATWAMSALPLTAGSFSIRAYLTNVSSVVLGFSMVGDLKTTNNDLAISNNTKGCCENNTISILNIFENGNCNGTFDGADAFGSGWTFNLKNGSGTIIKTLVTDINGNIFFSGVPDGTYTVVAVPGTSYVPSSPAGGTTTFAISGNTVKNLIFYNCK